MSRLLKVGLLLILIGIVAVVAVPLTTDNQVFSFDSEENYILTEKAYSFDKFKSFDFDFDNRNVFVYISQDDDVHLDYYLHEKDILELSDETDELTLSISRRWVDNFFIFDVLASKDYYDVHLYLPRKLIDSNLNIQSSNGDIEVDTDLDYQTLYIKSSNGDINISNARVGNLDVITSNGDINLENNLTSRISGKTSNGKINLERVIAAEIDMSTSNGKINANNITAIKVNLETSNGEIFLSMNASMDDFRIDLSTSLGDRIVNDLKISSGVINPEQRYSVTLKSSLGDVEVQFLED